MKKFKKFKIEDLTWGINVRDYSSEIEDKQAVSIENWNFKGNKLVSEKWYEAVISNWTQQNISAITIDTWDIWTVSEWNIYKNWNPIAEGTWLLISTNSVEFKSWVHFYINIEWKEYKIEWGSVEEFITNLKDAVEADWFTTVSQNDTLLIRKSDWTTIDYSIIDNDSFILYDGTDFESSPLEFGSSYIFAIDIDWDRYGTRYTPSKDWLNQWQLDIEAMTQLLGVIPDEYDASLVFLDEDLGIVNTYEKYAWIIINKANRLTVVADDLNYTTLNLTWDLAWKLLSLEIDWTYKTIEIIDNSDNEIVLNYIRDEYQNFLWDEYSVVRDSVAWGFVFSKVDMSYLDISFPNRIRDITINWWNSDKKSDIIIDGVTYPFTWWTIPTTLLFSQLPSNTYYLQLNSNVLTIARKDNTPVDISYINYDRFLYTLKTLSSVIDEQPSRDEVWGNGQNDDAVTKSIKASIDWVEYTWDAGTTNYTSNSSSISYTWLVVPDYSINTHVTYYIGLFDEMANWISNDPNYSVWAYSGTVVVSGSDRYIWSIPFRRTDYWVVSLVPWDRTYFYTGTSTWVITWFPDNRLVIEQQNAQADINISNHIGVWKSRTNIQKDGRWLVSSDLISTSFNVISLKAWNWLLGRSNLTIGNLGTVVIDKDNGGAYYAYDGINIQIGEDSIWEPTVWTIYNGKIVLWWYDDNDNIIFSKTSSPTQPLNVLNFTDYDSGWQSVSWGDKWIVTWMIVGENWLYVFKDNSIWYTNSEKDNPDSNSFNFIFRKITSNWALTQNVITEVEQEILYLDWKTREVRRLGYEQNLTTLRDVSISREISDLFDVLPEDQWLASASFSYPNYTLSLTDWTSPEITYLNWKRYHLNNVHYIYNVETKWWTKRTWIENLIVRDENFFSLSDWLVYKDYVWNTDEDGVYLSKYYTLWDDIEWKKWRWVDVVWLINPDEWEEKVITIEMIIDDEIIDRRTITASSRKQVRERFDMYDEWQWMQIKITHSWSWSVEVYDIQLHYIRTFIQPQN